MANHVLRVPLIHDQRRRAWPKNADAWPVDAYLSLADVMTRSFRHDAHFTAYFVPNRPYRLSRDAISIDGGVTMVLFIADIDCEQSHLASGGQGDTPASDDWWLGELAKLTALRQAFPGAYIYRTRGGCRVVYRLPAPVVLDSIEAVARWKSTYLSWCAALRLRFGIHADPACHDWQRLYRAPHATRTQGGQPEARETLGSPYQLGRWTCEPTAEEQQLAGTLAKRATTLRRSRPRAAPVTRAGDGILFYAFQARGWIGYTIEVGKWAVACPWEDQHSKGTRFNTSSILYAPGEGETLGWLHCSHAHCQSRDIRDVLHVFSEAELAAAEVACGIPRRAMWQGLRAQQIPPQSWRQLPTMAAQQVAQEVELCQL
jgi:hypothetical protein